jgi:DNA processing protein
MVDPVSGVATGALTAGGADRAEAEAFLILQRVPGLGDLGIKQLFTTFGSARAALAAPDVDFAAALTGGEPTPRQVALSSARDTNADRHAVRDVLAAADAADLRVVPMGSHAYPARLLDLADPPAVLFLRGRIELLLQPTAVALVGSRQASVYGRRTALWLGGALARAGVVVVSGLALGVDAEAHRGVLDAQGGTIAVLGSGADVAHPKTNAHLYKRIERDGLIVSEFLPGTHAEPHHFPRRNRIMAALARAVVVVEAAAHSGALITVDHANDLGREVFAVPGPIDAPTSAGANALIEEGAHAVWRPDVILTELGIDVKASAPATPRAGTDQATIWDALPGAPVGVDELAGRVGMPARRALAALSRLELEGWAVQSAGGRFARRLS